MEQQVKPKEEKTNTQVKLIKSSNKGGSLITRTSQACDRCRIKKIKCDGKIPSCTNCLSIGYNCQTSDKLTRRSFPKCYTESLEKNLMNLQDENAKLIHQIELLKKTRSNSFESRSDFNQLGTHVELSPASMVDSENSTSQNFFRYDNILIDDCYVGLNSFERLFENLCNSQNIPLSMDLQSTMLEESIQELNSTSVSNFLISKFIRNIPNKSELDFIIASQFENINVILPILDEGLFYDHYSQLFKSINNSTDNLPNLIMNDNTENNLDFIILLIIIIQLNTSMFEIHDIFQLLSLTNFQQHNSLVNFQTLLLSIQLFQSIGFRSQKFNKFLTNLSNLSLSKVIGMGLHLNYNNLSKINTSASDFPANINIYSIRLRLYWGFYALSAMNNLFFGHSNFKFLSLFDDFHIPKISSLINSSNQNSNLKNFDNFIKLVQNFNDVNLLSNNVYKNRISSLVEFQINELGIRDDNEFIKEMETRIFQKSLTQGEFIKFQFQVMVISLKFLLDIEDDENSLNFLKMLKLFNDSARLLGTFATVSSQFGMLPIDLPRLGLVAMVSALSKRTAAGINTSIKYLVISNLKVIKKRYFSVFKENASIISYIKSKTDSNDDDFNNESASLSLSNINHTKTSVDSKNLQSIGLFTHLNNYRTYNAKRSQSFSATENFNNSNSAHSSSILSIHDHSQSAPTSNAEREVRQLNKSFHEEIGSNISELLNQESNNGIWRHGDHNDFSLINQFGRMGSRDIAQL